MTKLYYIEDDDNIANIVKEYLGQKGYDVSVFPMITEAKDALENQIPDVILVDWNMPDGNGDVFCKWVRSKWKEIPISEKCILL